MLSLTFTNTLSGKKEVFTSPKNTPISLYVCGVTPYDHAHLGHGRCYVTFDLLLRTLRFFGYTVTYVRNYTDIDDKILKKAVDQERHFSEVAEDFITSYQQDMYQLQCLTPDQEPRVTTHIPEIINFIQGLIEKKHAYVLENDVYFDVASFASYGKLSKKNLDELIIGSRVEINENKKNPGDFALWKGNNNKQFWQSPWGYGRPGWHIECSAMAKKYLGHTLDIHGGGADLMFPHHENEIAQSEALHDRPFVRFWIHNAFVNINKEKMSKSLGNTVTLRNIFETYEPMILRYFFLQHHYRTPIDFSFELLNQVSSAYKKLIAIFNDAPSRQFNPNDQNLHSIVKELVHALADDLNSTRMMGLVFQHLDAIKQDITLKGQVQFLLSSVLGLSLQPLQEQKITITPEVQELITQREEARKAKDWHTADLIRDKLATMGISLHDKKV